MVSLIIMTIPAALGIKVELSRPCDDGHQDAFLRRCPRTKIGVGTPTKYEDAYGSAWEIDEVTSGAWVAISNAYSPKGKVFGSSIDAVKVKIEKWAVTNRPGTLFSEFGGVRVDGNGAFWTRVDRWAPALSTYPPSIPSGIRYVATSTFYSPTASLESMTELDLVNKIAAFAESHVPFWDSPTAPTGTMPKPPPTTPGTGPIPPGPSPTPSTPPTTPATPGPVVPVAKAAGGEGGALLYAGAGIGVAALIGWALLT